MSFATAETPGGNGSTVKGGAIVVLLLASSLTVLAGTLVAPGLPAMRIAFAAQPGADLLVRLVLTMHALGVVVGAPLAGLAIDRVGRRFVLLVGLLVYCLGGISGLWLPTLPLILAGRLVLGIGVAAVMVAATTLIADLASGEARGRLMGVQAAFMGLGGIVFMVLGGWLSDISWRWPFAVYAIGFGLVPAVLLALPADRPHVQTTQARVRLPRSVLLVSAAALVGMLFFYLVPVQLPFLLDHRMAADGMRIGLSLGLMTVVSSTSAFLYSRIQRRLGSAGVLVLTFAMMVPGLAVLGWAGSWSGVIAGLVVFGAAVGLLMPNSNLWTSQLVPASQRGKALGFLTTAIFLGQLLSPLVTAPLLSAGVSLGRLFLVSAGAAGVVALGCIPVFLVGRPAGIKRPTPVVRHSSVHGREKS